jgi:hypothetical protein
MLQKNYKKEHPIHTHCAKNISSAPACLKRIKGINIKSTLK